ncbi:MAG: hypothetical protein IPG74_04415 [Flavobacteriales bacterium]|nr:hypothetical protein [Flavobacteriales bacterium]
MTIIILYTVKIDLEGLNPIETVERARNHVVSMTGNLVTPTPIPALALVTTAADALEAAILSTRATAVGSICWRATSAGGNCAS